MGREAHAVPGTATDRIRARSTAGEAGSRRCSSAGAAVSVALLLLVAGPSGCRGRAAGRRARRRRVRLPAGAARVGACRTAGRRTGLCAARIGARAQQRPGRADHGRGLAANRQCGVPRAFRRCPAAARTGGGRRCAAGTQARPGDGVARRRRLRSGDRDVRRPELRWKSNASGTRKTCSCGGSSESSAPDPIAVAANRLRGQGRRTVEPSRTCLRRSSIRKETSSPATGYSASVRWPDSSENARVSAIWSTKPRMGDIFS